MKFFSRLSREVKLKTHQGFLIFVSSFYVSDVSVVRVQVSPLSVVLKISLGVKATPPAVAELAEAAAARATRHTNTDNRDI